MSQSALLEIINLSKHYPPENRGGVSNINLSIQAGDFVAIVGESGSGKSTLLKLIYGLLAPDAGEVLFKGQRILGPHEKLIPGHESMKMVIQDFDLNLYAKVYDNIASMLPNTDLQAKKQKTLEMMELLHIDNLAEKRIVELSGGEQQRVAIARAMITQPEVLLLDEPFSQVDAILKSRLRADLKRLCQILGVTIILVSHDPVDGMSLADDMIVIKDGEIIERGKPSRLYTQPSHTYTARLLGNAFVLSAADARSLGLNPLKNRVMIYPEWVQLKKGWSSNKYLVKDIFFKGFYEELLLEREQVMIRAVNAKPGTYQPGEKVQVQLERFLDFE